uniref:Zinc finger protein 608-like isoform X3 n=1 Tax=Saccoglossus kowalevskii TaxID=10224 RepID=A0ABM0LWY0_SACKO|nr:PREDICTED: zinc finger protein 608-like isoform X3 [Saccoglossus kowalevskii]
MRESWSRFNETKENINCSFPKVSGVGNEQKKLSPQGKMATVLQVQEENCVPYDSGDEWEIGLGDLIIDLDADLEKEKQHTIVDRMGTPESSPLKVGKMKIKRKTSSVKSDSVKYEITQKKEEIVTPAPALEQDLPQALPQAGHEHINGVSADKSAKHAPEDKGGKSGRSGGHKRDSNRHEKNSGNSSNRGSDSGQSSGSSSGGDSHHGNDGSGGSGRDMNDNNRDRDKDNRDRDNHDDDDDDNEEDDANKNEGNKNSKQKGKKSKTEKVNIAVGTSDMGTITEPECLAPCEPGTSVNLEGIVWHETERGKRGVLVVNVTWRNKTYVGTLLDCSRHDWAPPRFCDSPTSDIETRTPKGGGRGKRGRSSSNTPGTSDLSNYTETRSSIHSKLRNSNGKGRRGCASGSRTPTNGMERPGKRKSKPLDLDLNSSYDDIRSVTKRMRSNSRGTPTTPQTPSEAVNNEMPPSPQLIECPEPNCGKKYKHINGLRYHQTHAHLNSVTVKSEVCGDELDTESKSSSSEESTAMVLVNVKHKITSQSEYDFSDSNSKNTTVKGHSSKGAENKQQNAATVVIKQEKDSDKEDSPVKSTEKQTEKGSCAKNLKSKLDKVPVKLHKHSEKLKSKEPLLQLQSSHKTKIKKHVSTSGEDNTLQFQAMVENALSSPSVASAVQESNIRKDVVTVSGTVTPAAAVPTSHAATITSVIQTIKTEPGLKDPEPCSVQLPANIAVDKMSRAPREETRIGEVSESEGQKKREKEKHKSSEKEKQKKSNKVEKTIPKLKSARPIAPAPPVPQLIAIPTGFATSSTTGGTVTITPVTTNQHATPISPPLIPIQPKPTVMGEPMVNPSMSSLKEKKRKKKSKDREDKLDRSGHSKEKDKETKEKRSKQETEKNKSQVTNILERALTESGIMSLGHDEKGPSPVQTSESIPSSSSYTAHPVVNEPPKAVVAPTRPEIPKLIPSDSVPKSAATHVITSTPKSLEIEGVRRHDRLGPTSLSANTAAVAPNSHTPTEPLHVITSTAAAGSNQDAQSPAYSDISDANDDTTVENPKQCDDPYQFNDDTQPPAVKTHHSVHNEMRKERDDVSVNVYAPYSSNLTAKMHSPVSESKKRTSDDSLKYLRKENEKHHRKDSVDDANENKKARKDEGQSSSSAAGSFPEQPTHSPKMIPPQIYTQYPYMPGYMGYANSIDNRTYHMHLMATDPHYRQQHEKFLEEQGRHRMEQERMGVEKREKTQEKTVKVTEKEIKIKTEHVTVLKNEERKAGESENWPCVEDRMKDKMKEKQRENHQIMAESIELKSQVTQPVTREQIYDPRVLYDQRHQEDIRQQQQHHYMYQQKVLAHQRFEEEQRRHQEKKEKRERESMEMKEIDNTNEGHKRERSAKELHGKPEKEAGNMTKQIEEKKDERPRSRVEEKMHPSLDPKGHHESPKFAEGYPPYMQHPYVQSPHFGPVPFDPNHPAYRPVNPMMGISHAGFHGSPYLPPEFRYPGPPNMGNPQWKVHMPDEKNPEQERERDSVVSKSPHTGVSQHSSPERPTKALELLQQHASQYYSSHKGEPRQPSEERNKTVSPARPTSRSPAGHKTHGAENAPEKEENAARFEPGIHHELSGPMLRHLHTHHHTHVGVGYPLMAPPYDPYAAVMANQQAGMPPSIHSGENEQRFKQCKDNFMCHS